MYHWSDNYYNDNLIQNFSLGAGNNQSSLNSYNLVLPCGPYTAQIVEKEGTLSSPEVEFDIPLTEEKPVVQKVEGGRVYVQAEDLGYSVAVFVNHSFTGFYSVQDNGYSIPETPAGQEASVTAAYYKDSCQSGWSALNVRKVRKG